MRRPPTTVHQSDIVETLKKFLDAQSIAPRVKQYCCKCGSLLGYLQTQFWLLGGEQDWNIRLPYCPHCQPTPSPETSFDA